MRTRRKTNGERLADGLALHGIHTLEAIVPEILSFPWQGALNKRAGECAPTWEMVDSMRNHPVLTYKGEPLLIGGVPRYVCSHTPLKWLLTNDPKTWEVDLATRSWHGADYQIRVDPPDNPPWW